MRYARNTSVPVDRSKAEIERALRTYGAGKFGYMAETGRAAIGFEVLGRAIRMTIALPSTSDFATTDKGRRRAPSAAENERSQAERQRWRALLLVVKAKLEAVEAGITTFETEWLPYMVLPNGRTVAEHIAPHLEDVLANGCAPMRLLGMD